MIVSHEHEFIFIHIPRTAGTIVSKSLCDSMGVENWRSFIGEPRELLEESDGEVNKWEGKKHITSADLREEVGQACWNSYFKFAFVRNPWDRTVSVYLHSIKSSNVLGASILREKFFFNLGLEVKYNILRGKSVQQLDYISDNNGSVLVDFIGRYENLKNDFREVFSKIGLKPKIKQKYDSTKKGDYKKWYNKRGKNIVKKENMNDIKEFGYSYE